jgi:DNA-binding PadR family transcriptional regulator
MLALDPKGSTLSDVQARICAAEGRKRTHGQIHATIERLEIARYVESEKRNAVDNSGRMRSMRFYRLTAAGSAVLSEALEQREIRAMQVLAAREQAS